MYVFICCASLDLLDTLKITILMKAATRHYFPTTYGSVCYKFAPLLTVYFQFRMISGSYAYFICLQWRLGQVDKEHTLNKRKSVSAVVQFEQLCSTGNFAQVSGLPG
jgi:hypothetical protein